MGEGVGVGLGVHSVHLIGQLRRVQAHAAGWLKKVDELAKMCVDAESELNPSSCGLRAWLTSMLSDLGEDVAVIGTKPLRQLVEEAHRDYLA